MSPVIQRVPTAPSPNGPVFMDAELTPNRSLSPRNFRILFLIVLAVLVPISIVFLVHGFWPVTGFLGLDLLLIWLAFRASYRSGRMKERVHVTRDCIHVSRYSASGRPEHWVVNPSWARVDFDPEKEQDPQALKLRAGGRRLILGAFLSPPERRAFAEALQGAVRRAVAA
jgi:uncharacterized membrane protein